MNEIHHDLGEQIEDEELVLALLDYYPEAVATLDPSASMCTPYEAVQGGGKTPRYLRWDEAEKQCQNAVQSARELWDAEWRQRHVERSRKGGQVKSYTHADYLRTRNLNVSEAARTLGRARNTIRAMRREFDPQQPDESRKTDEQIDSTEHTEATQLRQGTGGAARATAVPLAHDDPRSGAGSNLDLGRPQTDDARPLSSRFPTRGRWGMSIAPQRE